jgi:hypothetical protein
MNREIVQKIVAEEFDAKIEDNTYHIDEERRLVVILQHSNGIMQVPKVQSLTFTEHYLMLTTDEDRYYVELDGVFGLKAGAPDLEKAEKRFGFHR